MNTQRRRPRGTTRNREMTEAGRVPLGNSQQSAPTSSGVRNGAGWEISSPRRHSLLIRVLCVIRGSYLPFKQNRLCPCPPWRLGGSILFPTDFVKSLDSARPAALDFPRKPCGFISVWFQVWRSPGGERLFCFKGQRPDARCQMPETRCQRREQQAAFILFSGFWHLASGF